MFTFDLISDTHWDFWVNPTSPEHTQKRLFTKIFDKIIPANHSKHIIIAGDLGHYNFQNKIALTLLRTIYDNVIWVNGNHDLYLLTKGIKHKYKFDSFNRTKELAEFAKTIPGLHYLDGNVITIDGINIGGCCGWYDNTYAVKELKCDPASIDAVWTTSMNDADSVITIGEFSNYNRKFNWEKYSKAEKDKLLSIHDKCSVIVTHIPPSYTKVKEGCPNDPSTTFYQFDGSDIIEKSNGKTWVFGHIHNDYDYNEKGCRFVTNALGYPVYANYNINELDIFKIKTIEIDK